MTKKDLHAYSALKLEIAQLKNIKAALYSEAEQCFAKQKHGGQLKGYKDPLPAIMDKLAALDKKLLPYIDRAEALVLDIEEWIAELPAKERVLIRARYIECKSWSEVARLMSYSIDNVFRLHQKITKSLQ